MLIETFVILTNTQIDNSETLIFLLKQTNLKVNISAITF